MSKKREPLLLMYPLERLPQPGEAFEIEGQTWVVATHLKPKAAWDGLLLAHKPNGYRKWLFGLRKRNGRLYISKPLSKW